MTDFSFVIPADQLPQTLSDIEALLQQAKPYARPPVSNFFVAALLVGQSGTGYIGVNLEFPGAAFSQTVHAEQFAVSLARTHGETGIQALYVNEMPCGHCRQFLLETNAPTLPITILNLEKRVETALDEILPHPFSLASGDFPLFAQRPEEVTPETLPAFASQSYSPYSQTHSAALIHTSSGLTAWGNSIESAAYNPTLPALQAALIHLVSQNGRYGDISNVYFYEHQSSPDSPTFFSCRSRTVARIQIGPSCYFPEFELIAKKLYPSGIFTTQKIILGKH